jgi:RNA polymerase sigma-70 factor, ECF subfamily
MIDKEPTIFSSTFLRLRPYTKVNVDEIATMPGRLEANDDGAALLRRARSGDLQAFEQIMREHDRQVFRVALRILGSVEDAQDAAQDVFLRLHRSLNRIDEDRGLGAWLYRVTVNICTDALRTRRKVVPIEDIAPVSPELTPLAHSEQREMRQRMTDALARLPEKERAAVVLREIEGLSTPEVAAILGSSEGTVRAQISMARTKLRKWLQRRRT